MIVDQAETLHQAKLKSMSTTIRVTLKRRFAWEMALSAESAGSWVIGAGKSKFCIPSHSDAALSQVLGLLTSQWLDELAIQVQDWKYQHEMDPDSPDYHNEDPEQLLGHEQEAFFESLSDPTAGEECEISRFGQCVVPACPKDKYNKIMVTGADGAVISRQWFEEPEQVKGVLMEVVQTLRYLVPQPVCAAGPSTPDADQ